MPKHTPEMIHFYENYLKSHIDLVNKYAKKYDEQLSFSEHDKSKFMEPEKSAYIFLFWYGFHPEIKWDSDEKAKYLKYQINHYKNNSHHVGFYDDITKMPEIAIIEMCCDWCAVAEYKNKNCGPEYQNPYDFLNKFIVKKIPFTDEQINIIHRVLNKIWTD